MNGSKDKSNDNEWSPFPNDAFPEEVFPEDVFPSDVFPHGDEEGEETPHGE
jgi:hypothetical protein